MLQHDVDRERRRRAHLLVLHRGSSNVHWCDNLHDHQRWPFQQVSSALGEGHVRHSSDRQLHLSLLQHGSRSDSLLPGMGDCSQASYPTSFHNHLIIAQPAGDCSTALALVDDVNALPRLWPSDHCGQSWVGLESRCADVDECTDDDDEFRRTSLRRASTVDLLRPGRDLADFFHAELVPSGVSASSYGSTQQKNEWFVDQDAAVLCLHVCLQSLLGLCTSVWVQTHDGDPCSTIAPDLTIAPALANPICRGSGSRKHSAAC